MLCGLAFQLCIDGSIEFRHLAGRQLSGVFVAGVSQKLTKHGPSWIRDEKLDWTMMDLQADSAYAARKYDSYCCFCTVIIIAILINPYYYHY